MRGLLPSEMPSECQVKNQVKVSGDAHEAKMPAKTEIHIYNIFFFFLA